MSNIVTPGVGQNTIETSNVAGVGQADFTSYGVGQSAPIRPGNVQSSCKQSGKNDRISVNTKHQTKFKNLKMFLPSILW